MQIQFKDVPVGHGFWYDGYTFRKLNESEAVRVDATKFQGYCIVEVSPADMREVEDDD